MKKIKKAQKIKKQQRDRAVWNEKCREKERLHDLIRDPANNKPRHVL